MDSDFDLIRAAQGGCSKAFNRLISRHREWLFRFLLGRCSCYADAEDALQDTLISAYRYINTYNQQWRFSTWLYRIALRNAAKIKPVAEGEQGESGADERDPLEHCIAASESNNLWRSAKKLLSDEVYSAMWLRYIEDMSVKEISSVLGRSTSWAKVNLLRGRRALEADMNKQAGQAKRERYG